MSILNTIESDVAKLAPIALSVVASIEKTLKNAAGATKKAIAVEIISNLAGIAETTGNSVASGIATLVNTIVGILNETGLFVHAAAPAAPPAAAPPTT
jgi:hypothetical protein